MVQPVQIYRGIGVPVDSAFDSPPQDGTLYTDDTTGTAYTRVKGGWVPTQSGTTAYPLAGLSQPLSGNWLMTPAAALSFQLFNNGDMRSAPLQVPRALTVSQIAVECTTAGSAGSVVRLGIYNSDPTTGAPTTLLVDGGTVVATGTGVLAVTISQALAAGLYHIASVPQGAPATNPNFRFVSTPLLTEPQPTFPVGGTVLNPFAFQVTGVTGALPASPTWGSPGVVHHYTGVKVA